MCTLPQSAYTIYTNATRDKLRPKSKANAHRHFLGRTRWPMERNVTSVLVNRNHSNTAYELSDIHQIRQPKRSYEVSLNNNNSNRLFNGRELENTLQV